VKGIGWFIEEYGVAQISMNLTNISVTPVHVAFDAVVERAAVRGIRCTGSELVGLIPLNAMLDAGRHFLRKQERSLGVSDAELIKIAVKSMGLDELGPFDPSEKIIEYAIAATSQKRLVDLTIEGFTHETASRVAGPRRRLGRGGARRDGRALGTMVANLSSHRRGWDERWEEFSSTPRRGKACHDELLALIDRDTDAFNEIMDAFKLPKGTAEEQAARQRRDPGGDQGRHPRAAPHHGGRPRRHEGRQGNGDHRHGGLDLRRRRRRALRPLRRHGRVPQRRRSTRRTSKTRASRSKSSTGAP
jgi:glutamate formiminotransferase/formiminotetrahydrofolate cyclodeaminase